IRPADVCGWIRKPSCSSTAISWRTVAGDTPIPDAEAMCDDPTGCAVAMYSCTTALRIAVLRSSSMLAVKPTECQDGEPTTPTSAISRMIPWVGRGGRRRPDEVAQCIEARDLG